MRLGPVASKILTELAVISRIEEQVTRADELQKVVRQALKEAGDRVDKEVEAAAAKAKASAKGKGGSK